jgi:NitT/TauT family transport system ATP-binding protein
LAVARPLLDTEKESVTASVLRKPAEDLPFMSDHLSIGAMSSPAKLEVRGLTIAYGRRDGDGMEIAVADVDFKVRAQEFICLVGPSGCGKSSILNVVAGLLKPIAGSILVDGKPVAGADRNRAVVFQAPALLPWRTALENVRYGLDLWGVRRQEANRRAMDMLRLVGLPHREKNYPHELSGGMQQRVNLARALAVDPDILLLDEPFAALDAQNRETMQNELMRIWTTTRKTSIFVTHQIDEAVLLADRVIVLGKDPGRIQGIIPIDLPRPRDSLIRRSPEFFCYEDAIRSFIMEEDSPPDLA